MSWAHRHDTGRPPSTASSGNCSAGCASSPTFGLLAATASDAARSGDTIWAALFWGLTLSILSLYFYVVRVWVTLVS
jgi:hypothetical protein